MHEPYPELLPSPFPLPDPFWGLLSLFGAEGVAGVISGFGSCPVPTVCVALPTRTATLSLPSLHLIPIPPLAARPDDRCCLFALPAGHGQEGAARVDTRVDAGGVVRCARGTCTGDRKSGSILVCMMRGAAPFGAHCGSHCHIAWRLPIFASSRSLSHPDASPFFEARLDTAPDALCGSVCRLSSSDTAPPLHAAFPHVPTAHRTCSIGCHDRSGGR